MFASSSTKGGSAKSKIVRGSDDALFGCVERNHLISGRTTFGEFLDAGTGSHSLRWIASLLHNERTGAEGEGEDKPLSVSRFAAVTADENMRKKVLAEAEELGIEDMGEILIGNWAAEVEGDGEVGEKTELCHGQQYDTILADYLVGAIDGFAPYFQDQVFSRLARHLRPGGRMYVVGLNPIPDKAPGDADLFCRVTRLRDACIKLAGHRCYREYPPAWIERHLRLAGLEVVETSRFPIMYSHATILRQLNVARSKLPLFPSKGLATEMGKQIDELEKESRAATDRSSTGRIKLGFDYVVTAEMPAKNANGNSKEST
mmetsp:Transcript_29228/g.86554  ORF Transcript_29228/g.86554 Transcript_29228/m.86554 type:complete len:317 (-) Transcript_29228:214-1164(-)